jgi:hypothetical protein
MFRLPLDKKNPFRARNALALLAKQFGGGSEACASQSAAASSWCANNLGLKNFKELKALAEQEREQFETQAAKQSRKLTEQAQEAKRLADEAQARAIKEEAEQRSILKTIADGTEKVAQLTKDNDEAAGNMDGWRQRLVEIVEACPSFHEPVMIHTRDMIIERLNSETHLIAARSEVIEILNAKIAAARERLAALK